MRAGHNAHFLFRAVAPAGVGSVLFLTTSHPGFRVFFIRPTITPSAVGLLFSRLFNRTLQGLLDKCELRNEPIKYMGKHLASGASIGTIHRRGSSNANVGDSSDDLMTLFSCSTASTNIPCAFFDE
ncbi:hypothetical protein BD310DRAFT_980575 [Dichomitus squalens]|uniref:Uncharacterized protein n=1 Tax=Dichomitus squalens TaxID=114155 RepID=A0A4Q9PJ69_9APHY|nr:hypothetical protein BD310DRAFT_980575 [Dichomitus squalens]